MTLMMQMPTAADTSGDEFCANDGDDGNYEDDGGTRPPHESCWGRVPPPLLQEHIFLVVTGAGEPDPNMTLGALLRSTVCPKSLLL